MLFEENEILTLILGVAAVFITFPVSKRIPLQGIAQFRLAILFLVCSYLFTNLEVLYLPDICNVMEHLFLAAAGASFLVAVHRLQQGTPSQ